MSASAKPEFDEVEVEAHAPTSARRSRYELSAGEGRDAGAKATEEESAAGPAVEIVFCLPDGTRRAAKFPVGQDVGYLKAYLHRTHDLAVDKQKFTLGDGKVLIDPLSLRDYPAIADATGPVNIIVQLAA